MNKRLTGLLLVPWCAITAAAGVWVPYAGNPVLGNERLGTCFDVNVVTDGPAPYTMYFSWRTKDAIALVRSDDAFHWTQEPEICLSKNPSSGWETRLNRSCTVKKDGRWHMWYTGQFQLPGGAWASKIGYAVSDDGVHFRRVRRDPVLVPEHAYERNSVMNPYVRWDSKHSVWRMWYAAGETYEPNVLCAAESDDGLAWRKSELNPVFGPGAGCTWDRDRVGACEVHPLPDGRWAMFYIGYSDVDTALIGCAISDDGITGWRRLPQNPIVAPDVCTWNGSACYKPSVVRDEKSGRWLLWYNGRNGCPEYVGMAIHDGLDLEAPNGKSTIDTKALLKDYVARFNRKDVELYTNEIANASAESFMLENCPRFACPDKDIERTYYFRWWTFRKHLRHDLGTWTVSEFLPKVGWSGVGNTIVCPAGHHLREGRWLRDATYVTENARFWLSDARATHCWGYSSWLFTGACLVAEVTGDDALPTELLDAAVAYYRRWEQGFERSGWPCAGKARMGGDGKGGFLSVDNYEGTEISLGGNGYKPLFASAMWSEAYKIAEAAKTAGRNELAAEFAAKAETARQSLLAHCWNPRVGFFTTEATNGVKSAVRELHGYAPWYFGVPTDGRAVDWSQLVDPQGFAARYGLTFPERRAKGFAIDYRGHECKWNGPSWPFATSIALTALANDLHAQSNDRTVEQSNNLFTSLLWQYADAQRLTHLAPWDKSEAGDWEVVPWIDENLNPDKAEWLSREIIRKTPEMAKNFPKERGKDYNHSTFCDLVISGLVGFVPNGAKGFTVDPLFPATWDYLVLENLRYRGHDVDIRWQRGKGLQVVVDGREVAQSESLGRLQVVLFADNAPSDRGAAGTLPCSGGTPLAEAKWLVAEPLVGATNVTSEFRTAFEAAADGVARLAIAADTVYAVELNGRTVVETARLPNVPPTRFYDEWTLDGVHKGLNELVVRHYYQGADSYQHIPGDPGLAFALEANGVRVTSGTNVDWRTSSADRAIGVPMQTLQYGFTFEYDAAAVPTAWRPLSPAECARRADERPLVRRPVAPSVTQSAVASRLVASGVLDGSPVVDDVARGMDATPMTPCELGSPVDPRRFGRGFYYLLDLGREETGLLDLDLDTDAGVVVDIGHAEHAENGRIRTLVGTRRFAGRYRTKEGRQSWTRWQRRIAGRFIQLHVRGVKTHFVLHRATVKPVIRDVRERPVPAWLDARQAAIWRAAVRTLRLSMHEHYEDCPWREQGLYANDARNQILCGRFAFADDGAFALHSLSLLARGLHDDGWLELCMPAKIPITIPSFTFSWNLAFADCLRLYGPSKELAELLPTAKEILDRHLGELEDGLLPSVSAARNWHFYDWADGLDNWSWSNGADGCPQAQTSTARRFDAPLNMLFLLALEADADVAEKFGENASAVRWRAAAAKLRTRIREFFWNESDRRFDTYRGRDVKFNGHEFTQALAILADVVPEDELKPLAEKLSAPSDWVETTLSQSLHKFEALAKVGPVYGRRARRTMETTWGAMLDAGATSFWETKEGWKAFGEAGSLCHGWSAVPVYFYSMHPDLLVDEDWTAVAARQPTDVAARIPHVNPWWAGPGFWDRRHEAKLKEIAEGPKEYDFVFLGDSITHNWEGWSDPIDVAVVDRAYRKDVLKFPNGPGRKVYEEMKRDYRLLNLGVGGESTQHVLWRLEHGEMDGYRAKGVMLMIGANNTSGTPEDVARGIRAVLAKIGEKQPQTKILLLPVFPAGERADSPIRLRHAAINRIIRSFADGDRIVWCDFTERFLEKDGSISSKMMPDFLHPLEEGYRIWRAGIEPSMRRMLGGAGKPAAMSAEATVSAAVARTHEISLWRGETTAVRLPDSIELGKSPDGLGMRLGVLRPVRYAPAPNSLQRLEVCDRVEWGSEDGGPRIVEFRTTPETRPGTYPCGMVNIRVVDRVLPPPKDWAYYLDLWQNPWAVARWAKAKPFSKEHYAAMKPVWELLASAGQKTITVTILEQPWDHQCFDAYHSMMTDDFKLFDEYVAFCRECGLGPYISCYSLCPWSLGKAIDVQALEARWGGWLEKFAAHLKEKGWFDVTYMSMDEREPEDVRKVVEFVQRHAPGLKVSMAGNRKPSDFKGIDIDCYSQILLPDCLTEEFLQEAAERKKRGLKTTFYTCCFPDTPNTFMSNGEGEAFWLGAFPAIGGLDGYLRWAWNSWPRNPNQDASYGNWKSGDTFLVYPDGSPSWRFLELRNGIVAAEKIRILREQGLFKEELAKVVTLYGVSDAIGSKSNFPTIRKATLDLVNK